jgi:hypothetical protein
VLNVKQAQRNPEEDKNLSAVVVRSPHTNTQRISARLNVLRGRLHSSVGVATCYELDGAEIESRRGRDFVHSSRPAVRPTQPPIQCVPGLSRE